MPWIKKRDGREAERHECAKPPLNSIWNNRPLAVPGDIWECPNCKQRWAVYEDTSSMFPYHPNQPVLDWRYAR